jgi:small subunit ribosomal protein S1
MPETGDNAAHTEETREEMRTLYETSMGSPQEGNIFKGKIITINGDAVIVDIGLKSEGKVPLSEFTGRSGEPTVEVGDDVEVMIVGREKEFGLLLLSKQRVDIIRTWQAIDKALADGTPVEGTIVSEVKGGFMVDIGASAFLPISQVDVKPVKNAASFIGRHLKFKVLKVNQRKSNVIISRRVLVEEERERRRQEFWTNVKQDQVSYGFVRNITDYGAFIDLGGVDGFLHMNEITWGRITHPKEYLRIGDEVKVKIQEIDHEKQRISVSIKQLKADPWLKIEEKYPVGTRIRGKAVGIVDYGVFVELEQGVEGLLHVTEMSWKRLKNPGKEVNKGDWLDLVVLNFDKEKKRISLGMKQLLPDPWDELENEYPPGSVVTGKVKNLTDFGLFIGVADGIDGLIHMSEISWSRRRKAIPEMFKKGSSIEALVVNIDKAHKKFSLSLKRLKQDPWKGIASRYRPGDVVEGYVTSVTDFGVFVELEEGIEGLIHLSEINDLQGRNLAEAFKLDEAIRVVILNIDEKDKRIALSIKALNRVEEVPADEIPAGNNGAFSTLADLLEPAINNNDREDIP